MKIGIIGTGVVGSAIGTRLVQAGHEVMMGSRTTNNEKAVQWVKTAGGNALQGTFAEAAAFGEIIFNCTKGEISLEALKLAGEKNLKGKVLVDVANPLDFSKGMPPILTPSLCNTNSLGEEIQKAFPDTHVVKALNTMNCNLMVNPKLVSGSHDVIICGNEISAKAKVANILQEFGWADVIDLGDITSARATEMLLPIWVRLMMKYQSPNFNFKIVK
ncbi:MAG TPA: NAD(P)-binding domain-containing protein [Bacteroidia bacterium]|nr:NAD(P)-binding domain-containing protein [Bacteroidia bacterium]